MSAQLDVLSVAALLARRTDYLSTHARAVSAAAAAIFEFVPGVAGFTALLNAAPMTTTSAGAAQRARARPTTGQTIGDLFLALPILGAQRHHITRAATLGWHTSTADAENTRDIASITGVGVA